MRAAVQHVYGPPEKVVHVEEVAAPTVGEHEVLVEVRAAGVNWADQSMTLGMPYVMRLGYGLRRPRGAIRGTDVAGTVVEVGSGVTQHQPGDRVFGWCTGALAEMASVKETQLVGIPDGTTFEEAAGIAMAGCVALQALRDVAKIQSGQKVLVVGASGGIGTFMVQIARSMGAEVTGVCSTPNVEFVRSLGADRVIDYTVIDYTTDDVTTGAERYDLIFDIADTHTLAERRRVLTEKGMLIPNSGEGGPWFGSIGRIFRAWIISPFVSQKLRPFLSMAKRDDLLVLRGMLEDGTLTSCVGDTFPLDDAGAAIAKAGSGHARGKVIVTV